MPCCLSILGILFIVVVIIKLLNKYMIARNGCYTCLYGKTVIVTGSNSGIGFYTALDLASRGAKVILACRNRTRAEDAQRKIIEKTGNPNVFVELIDFAHLQSVRDFAGRIKEKEDRLDILVNNAGAYWYKDAVTEDGLSRTMQVNYFGPFLLTTLLIDLLKKTGNSRIVNVASATSFHVNHKPYTLNYFHPSRLLNIIVSNYANSKLCMVKWTNELARRLKGTGVTVNALHPGVIYSSITRKRYDITDFLFKCLCYLFSMTEKDGAQTSVYVAVSKDLTNVSGQFFSNCKKIDPPVLALDVTAAKKLWEDSERMVKLTAKEKICQFTSSLFD